MVICLEQSADLHMAQLMPLSLTVSCFSKIQIGFTLLVPAHLGSPGKEPLNAGVCVCVALTVLLYSRVSLMGARSIMFATCPSVCLCVLVCVWGGYKNWCIIAYFVYICVCFLFTSLHDFVYLNCEK